MPAPAKTSAVQALQNVSPVERRQCALPMSATSSHLYCPALAVFAAQIVVGLQGVGNAHLGAIVVDLFSGAQGDDAEEHDLGETGGVLERTGGFHFTLGGVHPVHFVGLGGDARELLRG